MSAPGPPTLQMSSRHVTYVWEIIGYQSLQASTEPSLQNWFDKVAVQKCQRILGSEFIRTIIDCPQHTHCVPTVCLPRGSPMLGH